MSRPQLAPADRAALAALLKRTHQVVADLVAEHVARPRAFPGGSGNADVSNWSAMIATGILGLHQEHGMAPGAVMDLCALLVEVYAPSSPDPASRQPEP
jgi:hypothetical protein